MSQLESRSTPLIVALHGEIDMHTAEGIRSAAALAESSGYRSITFDFSDVTFMDSQGINTLLGVLRSLPPGGRLAIRHPSDGIRRVLDLTGVDAVIDIED